MKYRGVCDTEGLEMIAACKLSMFCSGHGGKSDIVLAKPRGMLGRDTAVFSNESHRSPPHTNTGNHYRRRNFLHHEQHVHITAGYVYCPVNGSVHVDYETITVGYSGSGKNNNKLFCNSKTMSKLYMGVI